MAREEMASAEARVMVDLLRLREWERERLRLRERERDPRREDLEEARLCERRRREEEEVVEVAEWAPVSPDWAPRSCDKASSFSSSCATWRRRASTSPACETCSGLDLDPEGDPDDELPDLKSFLKNRFFFLPFLSFPPGGGVAGWWWAWGATTGEDGAESGAVAFSGVLGLDPDCGIVLSGEETAARGGGGGARIGPFETVELGTVFSLPPFRGFCASRILASSASARAVSCRVASAASSGVIRTQNAGAAGGASAIVGLCRLEGGEYKSLSQFLLSRRICRKSK